MLEIPLHGGGVVAYQADHGKPTPEWTMKQNYKSSAFPFTPKGFFCFFPTKTNVKLKLKQCCVQLSEND